MRKWDPIVDEHAAFQFAFIENEPLVSAGLTAPPLAQGAILATP